MKNLHAVALGRLGGVKGGPARAKVLSAGRRREIAQQAGVARARGLSVSERQALARRAAIARWAPKNAVVTAQDAPEQVRRLLKSYEPADLVWAEADHRYAIVKQVLLRGDDGAVRWLRNVLSQRQVRELVRQYRGAGCNEPDRRKLRKKMGLTTDDIPVRPYIGLRWQSHA